MYDSKLYKALSAPSGFLSSPSNISLLGNTDGVALIRSSSYGVWPVFLVINELPPLQRYNLYLLACTLVLLTAQMTALNLRHEHCKAEGFVIAVVAYWHMTI